MINIKLADIIEKRLLKVKNSKFFFIADNQYVSGTAYNDKGNLAAIPNGTFVEIPGKEIIKYIQSTLYNLRAVREIDEIKTLNILDQEIFNLRNWKGTSERNIITAVNDIVSIQKEGLKFRTKEYPVSVVKLINDNRKKYNNIRFDGYLLMLLNENVLDVDVLKASSFFKDFTPDRIKELMEAKFLNQKQLINLHMQGMVSREDTIEVIGGLDNVVGLYKRADRNRNQRDSKIYLELIGINNAMELYASGKLSIHEISKLRITKEQIYNLPEELFVKVLKKGVPKGIEFSSDELIQGYIDKLSGESLIELAEADVIAPEKLIDLPEIEVSDNNKNRKLEMDVLKRLYTPSFIAQKLAEENLDMDFFRKWNKKIYSLLDDNEREETAKKVVSICKNEMNQEQFERMMHSAIQNELLPIEFFKENSVRATEIEEMYYNDEISEEEIMNYYNSNLLGEEAIQMLFGQEYDRMIKQITDGSLSLKALSIIPIEIISDNVIESKIGLDDVFRLYSEFDKAISAEELKYVVGEYEADYYLRKELGEDVGKKARIVDLINEKCTTEMIRELYIADVLSHSDILELKERGILTLDQSKEISKIDRRRMYQKIFDGKIVGAKESEKTEKKPEDIDKGGNKRSKSSRMERDLSKKKTFFKSLGNCEFKPVETTNPKEPFFGYTLIGYPEYGLVVLENMNSIKNNATYIITIEEFKSYIDDKSEESITITKGKLALKDEIKRGQAIQERYHVRLWGKNVIDTMRKLSDEAREGIPADTHIKLSEMMIDEFDREELDGLDPEDERAKRIIAEREFAKSSVRKEIRKRELRELKKEKAKKKPRRESPNHGEE